MRMAAAPVLVGLAVSAAVGCGDSSAGPPTLTGIDITVPAAAAPIMVHDTVQLVVAGTDQSGNPFPAGQASWQSRNPSVLQIDAAGKLVAASVGTATIVATVGTLADSTTLNVRGTRHRAAITSDETWTLAAAPHVVVGAISVGATLTIEAGDTVLFADSASLTFGASTPGALLAQGSLAGPITMRSIDPAAANGAWVGLVFRGGNASALHHVTVSDCGRAPRDGPPGACLLVGNELDAAAPTLLVEDVTVQHGSTAGVVLRERARFAPGSSALSVRDMRGYTAALPAGAVADFPLGGTFTANDTNEVRLTRDTVRDSVTWPGSVPWVVMDSVFIQGPHQPVLTIPAGSTVRFKGGLVIGMSAPGGLQIGADGGPTVHLLPQTTTWNGLGFLPYAVSSEINDAVLESCGTLGTSCVSIWGSYTGGPAPSPVLKNVTIRNAIAFGVGLNYGGSFGAGSTNLTITGTSGSPIFAHLTSLSSIPVGQYTGNSRDLIWTYQLEIRQDETWHNYGVPYLSYGGVLVGDSTTDPTLTIEPGVEIQLAPGARFSIGWNAPGAVRAMGTVAEPITFKGEADAPGSWTGIYFGYFADPSSLFDHAIVDYGGELDPWVAGSVHFYADPGPVIQNSVIRNSAGCGVIIVNQPPWSTDFTAPALGNTFTNNAGGAVCGP